MNEVSFETCGRNDIFFQTLQSGRFFVYESAGRLSQHRDAKVAARAARAAMAQGREGVRVYVVEG